MSQRIAKGHSFVNGDIVTAQSLNNLSDNASFVAGAGNTTDDSSLEVHQDGYLKIKDGGVSSAMFASDAFSSSSNPINVTNNNFTTNSIDGDNIVNNSLPGGKIEDGTITQSKFSSGVTFAPSSHTHSDATTGVSGFMSASDKTKLDGLSSTSGGGTSSNNSGEVAIGSTTQESGFSLTVDKNIYINANDYNNSFVTGTAYTFKVTQDLTTWPDGSTGNRGLYNSVGGPPLKTINGVDYSTGFFTRQLNRIVSLKPTGTDNMGNPASCTDDWYMGWARYTGGATYDNLQYEFKIQRIDNYWPPLIREAGFYLRYQQTLNSSGAVNYYANAMIPVSFSTQDFGIPGQRWGRIYTGYAVDTSSDIDLKTDIKELDEAEKKVAVKAKALIKKYKFKIAVKSKGDEARTHFGIIAQELEQAFKDEGLNPDDYGVLKKYDIWVGTDEEGNPRQEIAEFEGGVKKTEMSVRYDELWALIISAL